MRRAAGAVAPSTLVLNRLRSRPAIGSSVLTSARTAQAFERVPESTMMPTRREALRLLGMGGVALAAERSAFGAQPSAAAELLIRRGRVVNADGIRDADIRVVGETIAEVGPGLTPGAGARVIEAAGKLVMPGGIDPHTHLHPSFVDDFTSGSMAALAGGVTTVGTFATAQQGEALADAIERMTGRIRKEAIADVILHASAWPPSPEITASMKTIAELG